MKTTIVVGAILAILVLIVLGIGGCGVGMYNNFVTMDENTSQSWAQVENQYQRRSDLIPNLVEIVRGYAKHEKGVFTEVAVARASVGSMKLTPEALKDPKAFANYQKAQDGLSSVLSRLMMVTENYPTLKANENFMVLQKQLEGTENRIAVERQRFNVAAQAFNTGIRKFPGTIVASIGGFKERPYFQAEEGANKAPKVKF